MCYTASEVVPVHDHSLATERAPHWSLNDARALNHTHKYKLHTQARSPTSYTVRSRHRARMRASGRSASHALLAAEIWSRASRLDAGRPTVWLPHASKSSGLEIGTPLCPTRDWQLSSRPGRHGRRHPGAAPCVRISAEFSRHMVDGSVPLDRQLQPEEAAPLCGAGVQKAWRVR